MHARPVTPERLADELADRIADRAGYPWLRVGYPQSALANIQLVAVRAVLHHLVRAQDVR